MRSYNHLGYVGSSKSLLSLDMNEDVAGYEDESISKKQKHRCQINSC